MRRRVYGEKGLVKFAAGAVKCAVDIERVDAIVRPLRISPLGAGSELLIGMADYRGMVVPVVDACVGFSGTKWQSDRAGRWIVSRGAGRTVALAVDAVLGVTTSVTNVETNNYPVRHGQEFIVGVVRIEGDLLLLVDLDRLISQHMGTPKNVRWLGESADRERT